MSGPVIHTHTHTHLVCFQEYTMKPVATATGAKGTKASSKKMNLVFFNRSCPSHNVPCEEPGLLEVLHKAQTAQDRTRAPRSICLGPDSTLPPATHELLGKLLNFLFMVPHGDQQPEKSENRAHTSEHRVLRGYRNISPGSWGVCNSSKQEAEAGSMPCIQDHLRLQSSRQGWAI